MSTTDATANEILGPVRHRPPAAPEGERFDPLWWYSIATCNGMNRQLWLAPSNHHIVTMAKGICEACPAVQACLMHGLAMEDPWLRFGIFGATAPKDRDAGRITQEEAEATWREISVGLRRSYVPAA